MAISHSLDRRSSDVVLLVAGLLLVGLLVVPAMLPAASAQTEGATTTTTTGPTPTTAPTTSTTAPPTTTTEAPPPVERPDALLRRSTGTVFAGNNVYSSAQVPSQTRDAEIGWRGTASFVVRVENDGSDDVPILVQGLGGNADYTVRYRLSGGNITTAVVNAGYTISGLDAGAHRDIVVDITGTDGAVPGSQRNVWIRAKSGSVVDRVFAVAQRPLISGEQNQIRNQINATRRQSGRAPLAMHAQLAKKAQAWAEQIARNGRLSHSTLTAGIPAGWRAVAENVGYGSTLTQVHAAFLNSSGHRTNILGSYNYVGTGEAYLGGQHWIVHVFMLR